SQAPSVVVRRTKEFDLGNGDVFVFAFDLEAEEALAKTWAGFAIGQDGLRIVVALHGPVPIVEAVPEITDLAVRVAHVPAGDERLLDVGLVVAIGVFEIERLGAILDDCATAIE